MAYAMFVSINKTLVTCCGVLDRLLLCNYVLCWSSCLWFVPKSAIFLHETFCFLSFPDRRFIWQM